MIPEDDSFEPESSLSSNYELGMMVECMVRVYQRVRVRQRTNMISIERFTRSFLSFYGSNGLIPEGMTREEFAPLIDEWVAEINLNGDSNIGVREMRRAVYDDMD